MPPINTNPIEQAARMEARPATAEARPLASGLEESPGPLPNGSSAREGRDAAGRFTKDNKGVPGNPFAREVARIRKRIQAKLTDGEIDAIMDALMAKAKAGDTAAAKLLLAYGVGKPATPPDPDQLDEQEWDYWKRTSRMMHELPGMFKCMMAETLLEMVREARPRMSADLHKTMGQAFMNPESVMPPPMPDLVMARSDKALKRPRASVVDLGAAYSVRGSSTTPGVAPQRAAHAVSGRAAYPGGAPQRAAHAVSGGAADPRGSEYLASGRGEAATGASGQGCGASAARRRAWGLNQPRFGGELPLPNGGRGPSAGDKKKRSAKGNRAGRHGPASQTRSTNGKP